MSETRQSNGKDEKRKEEIKEPARKAKFKLYITKNIYFVFCFSIYFVLL